MTENVIINNDLNYLIIQALGWDYNLWSVILVDAILFGFVILVIFAYICFEIFILDR